MPSENGIQDSIFVFRFSTTLKMEFQLLFLFSEATGDVVVGIMNKLAALENILDEIFVYRFIIEENNSCEDVLVVIKNHYPNLRDCTLRSVKRLCSYHGIRKRISVADETVDIAVQGAISEVRCSNIIRGFQASSNEKRKSKLKICF